MTLFDSIEAWIVYMPILLVVWYAYHRHQRRASSVAETVLASSRRDGLMQPVSLHPVIDPARCLACGACVDACPEGSVLGIVAAKAELITPANCIGHGACKDACPFDAIRLVIGTEERGVEIPVVSPDFETNVRGLFVAGELGGMGLIRNGIEQGRQAMDAISGRLGERRSASDRSPAKRIASEGDDALLDVLIVGAGPAGLSASLAAQERGLRFETHEQESLGGTVAHYPRGKIVMTAPVDLPLYGRVQMRETTKEALLELWSDVLDRTGVRIRYGERVERVKPESDGTFTVHSTNLRLRARTVLLAVGRRGSPRKLGVDGEDQTKVVYRLIDPEQYRGLDVLVVGGGDSALEAACALAQVDDTRVTLSYRGESFARAKPRNRARVEDLRSARRLRVLLGSKVTAVGGPDVEIETASGSRRIDNDAVIVCAGGVVPTDFLRAIGVEVVTRRGES